MDFLSRIAKGFNAARAAMGSDAAGEAQEIALQHGGHLIVQPRIKRPEGHLVMRIETPLGEGLARIDLAPADAHNLAAVLIAFADKAASDAAKPISTETKGGE